MTQNKINTEEIMEQIRKNIAERGYSDDMLQFDNVAVGVVDNDDFDLIDAYDPDKLSQEVELARQSCRVAPVQYSDNKIKYFVKRVLRKADTIVRFQKHQIDFNLNAAKSLNQIEKYILMNDDGDQKTDDAKGSLNKDEKFVRNTQMLVERLENRVALLESEVEELRKQLAEK